MIPYETVSKYFELSTIAKGVFVAKASEGGPAIANACIVDLGKDTLIFDTFEDPRPAYDLKEIAKEVTGNDVGIVVNSHEHPDHWFGNQAFVETAKIYSTQKTYDGMAFFEEDILACKENPEELLEYIQELQEELEKESNSFKIDDLNSQIRRIQYNIEALPIIELHKPTDIFVKEKMFSGDSRKVRLLSWGEAHTSGDSVLLLEGEKILLAGDICFFGRQPFMIDGKLSPWSNQLQKIMALDVDVIVPGHGPVGDKEDIYLMLQYFDYLENALRESIGNEDAVEAISKRTMPAPFDKWPPRGLPLKVNVEWMHKALTEKP
jgi:glyoxylase-like metal-dependent hydrolase (beta-lactamase superfamily II)